MRRFATLAFLLSLPSSALAQDADAALARVAVVEELAASSVQYGPQHPEIIRLRAELDRRADPALGVEEQRAFCTALERREAELVRIEASLSVRHGLAHPERERARARVGAVRAERRRRCS
jgi:hypothetical protein